MRYHRHELHHPGDITLRVGAIIIVIVDKHIQPGQWILYKLLLWFKFNHSIGNSVIPIYISLNCSTFINLLYSEYEAIFISIGVVLNGALSSVNVGDLFPAIGFAWWVVVDCGELEGVSDSKVEFILAVFVVVLSFFDDVP